MAILTIETYSREDGYVALCFQAPAVEKGGLGAGETEREAVEAAVRSFYGRPRIVQEETASTRVAYSDEDIREMLAERSGNRVKITYIDADGASTERTIRIGRTIHGGEILQAWDSLRNAPRTFRVNRIQSVEAI